MNKMDARRKQILSLIYTVGMIVFCFLINEIGEKAGGYLMVLSLVLICFFLPFFAFLPVAIEKPLRARISKGQIKNANGLWNVVFTYSIFSALILSLSMAFIMPIFSERILGLSNVTFCLPYLALGFFFLGISRALCMYFQGKGSGLQTVIASALIICFSILFSFVVGNPLLEYGQKVATLMGNDEFKEQYLMVGISIGIGIASVITFVFLLFAYFLSARENRRKQHVMRLTEHKGDSIRIFVSCFFPYWFATILMLVPLLLGFVMFFEKQDDKILALITLGRLTQSQYLPGAIVLLFTLSFVVLIVAQIVTWMKKEEIRQAREGFKLGLVWTLIMASFAAICFVIFGSYKIGLIYFVATFAYFFSTLLWQGGKRKSVLISMFTSMVGALTSSFLLSGILKEADLLIFVPVLTQMTILTFTTCFFLIKHYRFLPDLMQGLLFPIFSSFVSGIIMYVICLVLQDISEMLIIKILVGVIGLFVHLTLCMVLQCGNDNDIMNLPGGKLWIFIGNHLHLFH